jgi:hypothetical protein
VSVWFWIFVLLMILGKTAGTQHPPVDHAGLGPKRKVIAIVTLALYVLLFMPTPMVIY